MASSLGHGGVLGLHDPGALYDWASGFPCQLTPLLEDP